MVGRFCGERGLMVGEGIRIAASRSEQQVRENMHVHGWQKNPTREAAKS
jgi:hypothetical protein